MPHCVDCGSDIPEGQHTCSMCYGDPYYGSDGYYLDYLREIEQRRYEEDRYNEYCYEQYLIELFRSYEIVKTWWKL